MLSSLFFFYDTPTTEIYTFPTRRSSDLCHTACAHSCRTRFRALLMSRAESTRRISTIPPSTDRKSTRLNSSHRCISYAVFCLKKKKQKQKTPTKKYTNQNK